MSILPGLEYRDGGTQGVLFPGIPDVVEQNGMIDGPGCTILHNCVRSLFEKPPTIRRPRLT